MPGARTHDEDAAPAERAAPPATGLRDAVDAAVALGRGGSPLPSQVLALQRAWGNRAVANTLSRAVLARQETAVDTPETAYTDAVAHNNWDGAARALAAMDDAGRRQHAASAPTSQLMSIAAAAEAANLPAVRNAVAAVLTQPARAAEAAQINHDKAFADALAIPNWDQVAQALSAYDDAGMDAKLATMHLEQLNETSAAAGRAGAGMVRVREHAETARIRKLGQEWESAYQHGNWERAVTLVQAYNDADLPGRLGALNYDQLVALKAQAGHMPSYARVAGFAEPVRVATLGREYEAAVNAGNWARATVLVNAYNDLDLLGRLRFIQGKGAAAMTAATAAAQAQGWDDNHRVRRGLAFLQLETQVGPTARPASPATGWTLGTGGTAVAVTGGTVTAYSAVASGGGTANWYALQYQGTNAQNTGWIQFISREIERFDAATGGTSLGFYIPPGALTHLGQPGTITYGTSTAPNWYVDTFSNTLPFYESPVQTPAGGAALPAWAQPVGTRGGNISVPDTPATPGSPGHPATAAAGGQTTMIDNPGTVGAHVTAAFAPVTVPGTAAPKPVLRVEARARFHEYLVRGQEVLYENTVVVQDTFTSAAGAATRVNTPGAGGAANKLRTPHYQALIRRFPQFTYFPH